MNSSECESLIFEVRDQARNCFIIKAMWGLKRSKRPGLNKLGGIASAVCVWIILTAENNSNSGQAGKHNVTSKFLWRRARTWGLAEQAPLCANRRKGERRLGRGVVAVRSHTK